MKTILMAGACALSFAMPAVADITISDAYMRTAFPGGPTGAAFMMIENTGSDEDRLVEARSDIAARVELHTHKDMGDGVMKMMQLEDGMAIPAEGMHHLKRGGDHVMFMGLTEKLETGQTVSVTLVFEKAGEVVLDIPVDLDRKETHGDMDHSGH